MSTSSDLQLFLNDCACSFILHIENACATPPHLDVFCDLGAMGRCRVLCPLCFWASELVAALLDLGSCRGCFCPPGWTLCPLGLHFESFESLWCEPEAPGARHREKFEKISKMKRLGSLIGSFLGHILSPLPPKIEPTSVLLRSFVNLFSRAFLAVFRRAF